MPNFEVLDARISSALNKIINNSQFKRRISLEEQEAQKHDRFLRGRQIAYLIYDHFRVTGSHDSVENYTDLFIPCHVVGQWFGHGCYQWSSLSCLVAGLACARVSWISVRFVATFGSRWHFASFFFVFLLCLSSSFVDNHGLC